jgi:predicted transcriptional regulator
MHITNSATYYYISNKNNSYYDAKKNKNIISRLYNKFEDNKYKNKSFLYDYNDKKLRRFEIETQTQAHNKFKERQ